MLGIVNRAIECFARDTYGHEAWHDIVALAELGHDRFEAMLSYDDNVTEHVLDAAETRLAKSREEFLEDLGTYLVSHPSFEPLRRLLRFGGETYVDFLLSLDELPERARLAVPDLDLPDISVTPVGSDRFSVRTGEGWSGFGPIMAGAVRGIADDYGALAILDCMRILPDGSAKLDITVHEARFSSGRKFDLSARTG